MSIARCESAVGTILPCRLPLGLVRKVGSSCQWCARGTDLPQWKVDRPSRTRRSIGEDDPYRKSRRLKHDADQYCGGAPPTYYRFPTSQEECAYEHGTN